MKQKKTWKRLTLADYRSLRTRDRRREIAKGQRDEVALQPNLVFEAAIKEGAKSVIVAHNHPSGDPPPSDGHSGYFSMAAAELIEF